MSDKKIQLPIFNPFGQYFHFLYEVCNTFDASCVDKNFMGIITNDCDVSGNTDASKRGEVSDRFKEALKLFALNLKNYDYPISKITIKGELYKIFNEALNGAKLEAGSTADKQKLANSDVVVNKIVAAVNKKEKDFKFKMSDNWGSSSAQTYQEVLKDLLDNQEVSDKEKLDDLKNKVFNSWLSKVFEVYQNNIKNFDAFLSDIETQWKDGAREFELAHLEAFNTFFEIVDINGQNAKNTDPRGGKNFWNGLLEDLNKVGKLDNYKGKDNRINIKVVRRFEDLKNYKKPVIGEQKLMAGIVFAFPSKVRAEFNEALLTPPKDLAKETARISEESNFYKIKKECEKGSYKLDESQVKEVFNFIKNKGKPSRVPAYVEDVPDNEEYKSSDGSFTIEEAQKDLAQYRNVWAKDLSGNLYTKLDEEGKSGKKFRKYTEKDVQKDIESFKNKSGDCGHLCIFEDVTKCNEFFQAMYQGKEIAFDKLAEMVNSNGFMNNYNKLKENIVKVNPAFIIGTLRAFKFQKWEKINPNGTKTIKVESFTNWWNRQGILFMDNVKKVAPGEKTHSNKDESGKELLDPVPPENLELFLKLLVSFINYNEFVLNPQSSNNILYNRLPTTTIHPNLDAEEPEYLYFVRDGKTEKVPNGAYNRPKKTTNYGSLASALQEIKRNINFNPVDPGLTENRSIMNALMGISMGVNNLGRFVFTRPSAAFATGVGYGGAVEDSDETKALIDSFRPCSRTAWEGLALAEKNLLRKGKKIDKNELEQLQDKVKELAKLEDILYESLDLIGKYEKVIVTLKDDTEQVVDNKIMEEAVENYKIASKDFSSRTDNFTTLLMKVMNNKNVGTQGYSDL